MRSHDFLKKLQPHSLFPQIWEKKWGKWELISPNFEGNNSKSEILRNFEGTFTTCLISREI